MKRFFLDNHSLRHALPFAAACFTFGLTLFACADKDVETNDNNGKALVAFNVSTAQAKAQDQAQAAAKSNQPVTRSAFVGQLALQYLTPEDLTMQKLPVQGPAASSDICLIETTLPGLPSQWEDDAPTRANITTIPTMQNFSTTAFYGSSDASLAPWFYDKDTKKDGNLVTPIYWDWFKNHGCFYAVYPKPDNSKLKLSPASYAGTPYVDFEVDPSVKNQKDLMTACSGNVHLDAIGAAPRTNLTFRHALTAVRFKVGENLSWNKTITKVEIVGANSKGKYTLPTDKDHTGTWGAISAPATFTLGGDGTVNVSTSEAVNNVIMGNAGDNYVFYMIPQTLTGVSVNIYFDNATTPSISVPLPGKWKPGTTKTYALSQNTSTWKYQLTATPMIFGRYNFFWTGDYAIQSYRQDPATNTLQKVPWKVVGYSTDGGLTWSNNKPAWIMGLTKENGVGSTDPSGETGQANIVGDNRLHDKLDPMNAALKLDPKGSSSDYYDLSTHDVKGNVTPRNTANCYVISHPGYYKIPLVYGNAIKNGMDNTNAYQTSNTGTYILTHFKDHDNKDITNPWIEKTNGGANNGVNGVKLIWADQPNPVHFDTNPIVRSGNETFVQFEVKASDIKNGNAVIAVTKDGTVVWSWHLWFIYDDALNTITCTNFQGKEYKFTQEPLGMRYESWLTTTFTSPRSVKVKVVQNYGQGNPVVPKESIITIMQWPGDLRRGYATLYQFGRKDAFPSLTQSLFGIFNQNGGHNMSIPNSIQHPENFYLHNSPWYWSPPNGGYTYHNLWSANNTTRGYNDDPVVKTVYDPCPAGFRLPASNAFTGFNENGDDSGHPNTMWEDSNNNAGCFLANRLTNPDASIYFPFSGYRSSENGGILKGYYGAMDHTPPFSGYWTAIPKDDHYSCACTVAEYRCNPKAGWYRSVGFCVRPVADN